MGFQAVVSSQQRWVSRSGGISVVVASWWWWSPSAGGIPGSHTLLGLCHKAQAARHLPPPQSPQSWAPPKASTAIQPGSVWLSTGQRPPAGRSRLCWKRLGKGSVGTRLAAGSSQLPAEELSMALPLPRVSSATVKPGFEGRAALAQSTRISENNEGIP